MEISKCKPSVLVKEEAKWLEHLKNKCVWDSIPYVNSNDFCNFQNGNLVKFRGMVQDMQGPEFYVEEFQKTNKNTGDVSYISGKYIDCHKYEEHEEVEPRPDHKTGERHLYVVISVPGVNQWVTSLENQRYKIQSQSSCSKTSKRPIYEQMGDCSISNQTNKRQCTNSETNSTENNSAECVSPTNLLNNFPITDPLNKICLMLVYNNTDGITLNGVYDFVGFLTISGNNKDTSMPPRIHCVTFKDVNHCNPLIDNQLSSISDKITTIRKELLIVLTNLLFGDELAAEYLIFHLISNVYMRKELLALGKFSLNISQIPQLENLDYPETLYKFIELLTTKSYYLPMTLKNMNELNFIAKKNYNDNRLMTSVLQLSSNTVLVLDETKLTTGQLNENGVRGIRTISHAIEHQKINYDFTYYQIEYDSDIQFLILSEGKSLLPSDCHIPLQADEMHLNTFKEITEAARHFLKPELLNQIRTYLTATRLMEYKIEENVEELIQKEYVEMRQKGTISADDLHHLLVLGRLICLSEGKSTLDANCWKRACALETARKERLKK